MGRQDDGKEHWETKVPPLSNRSRDLDSDSLQVIEVQRTRQQQ